jgi:SNF2 family DNA or RNA helicase
MDTPILSYDPVKERLQLDLPGWTVDQVKAINEKLVCWYRRDVTLYSIAVRLARNEVVELFSDVILADSMGTFEMERGALDWTGVDMIAEQALKKEQIIPANLLQTRNNAILTAAPGLGKTVIAAVALRERAHRLVVVVAPLSSLDSWETHLQKWYAKPLSSKYAVEIRVWRKPPATYHFSSSVDRQVLILSPTVMIELVNTGQVEELLGEGNKLGQVLILDESFLYKNRDAKRMQAAGTFAQYFGVRWMLSGMPVAKFNDDLYAQLYILFPGVFRSYWKFAARYCLLENSQWGTKIVGDSYDSTRRIKHDLSDIVIECDYPEDIPDWQPETVYCPMDNQQTEVYNQLRDELIVDAALLGLDKPLALKTILTLSGRLLQVASNPLLIGGLDGSGKWATLLQLLPQNPLPALVWINYIQTGNILYTRLQALGYRVAKLTGEVKPRDRQRVVDAFQAGDLDILLIHPGVGKYSHTLTAAKTSYYLERNFDREANYQSLFRVRRIISTHSCKLIYLLSTQPNGKPTIDQIVHNLLVSSSKKAQLLTVGKFIGSL